jgi:hypothetical protein
VYITFIKRSVLVPSIVALLAFAGQHRCIAAIDVASPAAAFSPENVRQQGFSEGKMKFEEIGLTNGSVRTHADCNARSFRMRCS